MTGTTAADKWPFKISQLKKLKFDNLHKWVIRALCLILTCQWYWFAVRWDFEPLERFAFKNLILITPYVFFIWNLGLWLSTTKWGIRHKLVTSILMVPAFIASPIEARVVNGYFASFVLLAFVWSFWRLYKRKAEQQ
jgi:hypothetical protein